MEIRKFILSIKRDYEYAIFEEGFKVDFHSSRKNAFKFKKISFGIHKKNRHNKLAFILSHCICDKDLIIAKTEPSLQEICDFSIILTDNNWNTTKEQKIMTFYDALVFTNKKMKEFSNDK